MRFAMIALLKLGVEQLKMDKITLSVYADNERAVKFYENLGFTQVGTIPLYWRVGEDESMWDEEPEDDKQEPGKFYAKMVFDKEFLKQFN